MYVCGSHGWICSLLHYVNEMRSSEIYLQHTPLFIHLLSGRVYFIWICHELNLIKFADDIAVVIVVKDIGDVQEKLN